MTNALPDGVCNPVRDVFSCIAGLHCRTALPDGVQNISDGVTNPGHDVRGNIIMKKMSGIFKVSPGEENETAELLTELNYQLSLTTAQRFEMMFRKSREIAEILLKNGYRKPFEIIKRT